MFYVLYRFGSELQASIPQTQSYNVEIIALIPSIQKIYIRRCYTSSGPILQVPPLYSVEQIVKW